MKPSTVLVLSNPAASNLRLLEELPEETSIVVGNNAEAFEAHVREADVILSGMGMETLLEQLLPQASNLRWIHSLPAGVETLMRPAILESTVPLTNGRGVFSESLGEFVMAAALYFAKDFRRMTRSQQAGVWDPFDVEWIEGKTMGIVGYGRIGSAIASRAKAFGMRVLALRRRPELCAEDKFIEKVYPREALCEMLACCHYVAVAAPLTRDTRALIGEDELRAMRPGAVLINVGRGPVVDEAALIAALRDGRLRGAALDEFDREPLPEGHPFYNLENVLLSPHCADHTPGWTDLAMRMFVGNFARYRRGEPLENLVDKSQGY